MQWPRGFSRVAKDLISKLLKTIPAQRLALDEICDHPWFKNNQPIRHVTNLTYAESAVNQPKPLASASPRQKNPQDKSPNIQLDGQISQ